MIVPYLRHVVRGDMLYSNCALLNHKCQLPTPNCSFWDFAIFFRQLSYDDTTIPFPVKRYMIVKMGILGRHKTENFSVGHSVEVFVSSPLSHFWPYPQPLFFTDLAYRCWEIDSAQILQWLSLTAHNCLIQKFVHKLFCPCSCQLSISERHCTWINFVYVCVHLFCPSRGGQLLSLFGVRLPVRDIRHGRYPTGPKMYACLEENAFTSITSCAQCLL